VVIETHKRSIVKAITYRAMGTLFTFGVVFIVTGELKLSATIGIIDSLAKIFGYFVHERIWNRIKFGLIKEEPTDYEI